MPLRLVLTVLLVLPLLPLAAAADDDADTSGGRDKMPSREEVSPLGIDSSRGSPQPAPNQVPWFGSGDYIAPPDNESQPGPAQTATPPPTAPPAAAVNASPPGSSPPVVKVSGRLEQAPSVGAGRPAQGGKEAPPGRTAPRAAAREEGAAAERPGHPAPVVGPIAAPEAGGDEQEQTLASTRQARTLLQMKDYDAAIASAGQALEAYPANAEAYNIRAAAYNLTGRHAQAQADALRSIEQRPSNPPAYEALAWAQLRQGAAPDAIRSAGRAIELKPDDALAYALRAYARQMTGDAAAMRADIRRAAALDARFQEKARRAAQGEKIYDPALSDSSFLLELAASVAGSSHQGRAVATSAAAAAALVVAGLLAWRARRPRSAAGRVMLDQVAPGENLLGGRYRLDRVIGRGGMGEVYRAQDVSLARPVAIKKLCADMPRDRKSREGLIGEARTVAALHHPAIVDIYEILEERDDLYLVFEFVSGKTVAHLLAENNHLSLTVAAGILQPVCDALSFAHGRGLVHRDIKPANIMVTEEGHIKLMDFGIARAVGTRVEGPGEAGVQDAAFARTRTVVGTPCYMAPEMREGIVSKSGDIYALGICLYEMLTGLRPAPARGEAPLTPPSALSPGLPAEADALVAAAAHPDPAQRLQSAAEFMVRLAASVPRRGP